MRNDVETFEEELNSIISICDEKIKRYRALLDEYQMIKGSALSLLNMNNNTKRKVVSLINALKMAIEQLRPFMKGIDLKGWCGRRDLNPGRRLGRPVS